MTLPDPKQPVTLELSHFQWMQLRQAVQMMGATHDPRIRDLQETVKAASLDKSSARLYVARIWFKDHIMRHVICRLRSVNKGAAYEYIDPLGGHVVGSVGFDNLDFFTKPLDEWMEVNT